MTVLTVAGFPATHPYIEAVRPAGVRLSTPATDSTSGWAPHPWWEPAVLATAAAGIDVLHVHFGYDHLQPEQLRDWTQEVARLRLPLVVTVHDLRNPHHDTAERHDAHLDALLAAADEVLTLTPGAAHAIADRWHRVATVAAHPSLLTPPPRPSRMPGGPVVGVHLKSLRRNLVEPGRVVAAAAQGALAAGGTLVVDAHPDVAGRIELDAVRRLSEAGGLRLRIHERFTDDALVAYLQELDVSVLPNRFGTHSGWLELCRDMGTRVVAPDCGFYAEQWPAVHIYRNSERSGLADFSLRDAVSTALAAPRLDPAAPTDRLAERTAVRRLHADVYRRAMALARAAPGR